MLTVTLAIKTQIKTCTLNSGRIKFEFKLVTIEKIQTTPDVLAYVCGISSVQHTLMKERISPCKQLSFSSSVDFYQLKISLGRSLYKLIITGLDCRKMHQFILKVHTFPGEHAPRPP